MWTRIRQFLRRRSLKAEIAVLRQEIDYARQKEAELRVLLALIVAGSGGSLIIDCEVPLPDKFTLETKWREGREMVVIVEEQVGAR